MATPFSQRLSHFSMKMPRTISYWRAIPTTSGKASYNLRFQICALKRFTSC